MAAFTFNVAKGKIRAYAELPAANDALLVVPLEAAGLEADAALKDYDDLAALLAGASNEQVTLGRKTVTSITITVDDVNDWVDIDLPDQVWAASAGNPTGALLFCYDADTTTGTDASVVPLTKHDWATVPDGSDIQATIAANGILRVQ